jgi:hypothetical protein
MKRDLELIRLLLLEQETGESSPELKDYDEMLKVHNIALMQDAGLIEGSVMRGSNGRPARAVILRLTWAGHDFLDSTRDPKVWNLAKEKVLKPGISWSFSLLVEFLKAQAHQRLFGA